ncbi:MAG: nucleotidyltransferase domain-containing protein [Armatimonadota bacterium]|nr:nucleotidyltransferase domain-containing protein [Armatimonadota bacterium]MDR5704053.1 nucleotidyltransferase domain-containing protein [Armatimonadota bacterium]MDR7435429.1 nucleotidyltransferase domain-containing protein [Armatimonadota bacterium]
MSWHSVRVRFLDRERILARLREEVDRLKRAHPEVARVIVFGSFARGDAVPGSDLDVVLILTHSSVPFLERLGRYHLPAVEGVPVEVFPYTEEEWERMVAEEHPWARRVLKEGIELA